MVIIKGRPLQSTKPPNILADEGGFGIQILTSKTMKQFVLFSALTFLIISCTVKNAEPILNNSKYEKTGLKKLMLT